MAGQNYTWQVSTPSIGTGQGVISSAYNVDGKSPFTTITIDNPTGYTKVFPNSNSTDLNIKNLEYAIQTDGKITYRVQDGTQNPRQYNSLQELAGGRGGWTGTTTTQVQSKIKGLLQSFVSNYNQRNPDFPIGPATANQQQTQTQLNPTNIPVPTIETQGVREEYDNYHYPETLAKNENKQDIIKFTAYRYEGRGLNAGGGNQGNFGSPGLDDRKIEKILGSVTLPIQPSITDTNLVQWGNEDLNALQAYGAAASYGAQTDIGQAAEQVGRQIDGLFKSSNFGNAARVYLAGKAVGVNGLLSRIGGGILNPNTELLFQGPQLRPFNFTFRLSPRNDKEANQVRNIIRFFKENMSVQNTESSIFLKAPNVFKINYLSGRNNKDHPSLNRIKICALQSFNVDYTPDGSYMTFNDESLTMTSYNLTLQFQELEPVTAKDYTSLNNEEEIGY